MIKINMLAEQQGEKSIYRMTGEVKIVTPVVRLKGLDWTRVTWVELTVRYGKSCVWVRKATSFNRQEN